MRLLAVSDLHGNLAAVTSGIEAFQPDGLLCCGDWGDDHEVDADELTAIVATRPVLTTFGNHDPVPLLRTLINRDGTPILLEQGEVRSFIGLSIAAIGGIWAGSHRKPYYVTNDDVARYAAQIAAHKPIDLLLTHASPVGLADLTESGRHGGQRCFLDAFKQIEPRIQLCGHLHVAQERTLRDGRRVINVGATPTGSVVVIEFHGVDLNARLDHLPRNRRD